MLTYRKHFKHKQIMIHKLLHSLHNTCILIYLKQRSTHNSKSLTYSTGNGSLGLFNDTVCWLIWYQMIQWLWMSWKIYGRKQSWHILGYSLNICLTDWEICHDNYHPGQGPPEYDAGVDNWYVELKVTNKNVDNSVVIHNWNTVSVNNWFQVP
jgi:hypothetical protein